jgi:TetR/AcrR family acrAB operon transcriptional repressor
MRRTKEEAARTRSAIVDAALECFDRHGIAHATLDVIAAAAGVTKGAIYWHFEGKGEILHAIREGVSLPLLDRADVALLHGGERPALERIERFLGDTLELLEADPRTRTAMSVMQFKCEYVDDLAGELEDGVRNSARLGKAFEGAYAEARKSGELAPGWTPKLAALETLVFLSGLLRLWLLDKGSLGVRKGSQAMIRAHVQSRRA